MYRFPITIDKTKVQGSNTKFPYLFSEGCAGIPSGFWSHVKDTSGLDIRFFDSGGILEFKREIVTYSSGSTKVEAWVQIPILDSTSNRIIYCQYGGPIRSNDISMWSDMTARAIYHLQNDANDSDSTNNGAITGATNASAKIENGYTFGGSHYITVVGNISFAAPYTLSAWVYSNTVPHDNNAILSKTNSFATNDMEVEWLACTGSVKQSLQWYGSSFQLCTSNSFPPQAQWNHLAASYDGSNVYFYLNGSPDGSTAITYTPPSLALSTYIGSLRPRVATYDLAGKLDEVRVIGSNVGSSWIATEYANQNAPSTFSSCGAENSISTAKFQIKIDKTKVQGSHTNFPYLFSEACTNLPAGIWRDSADSSGLDIRFYDTDKSTELKREVALYDFLNKKVEIWVQIPSLDSTSDKYIWCTYGDATRANDQTVWSDIGAIGAYHFQGNAKSSAGAGKDGTVTNATQVDGLINKAYNYAGGNSYITLPLFSLSTQFVISLWFNSSDTAHNYKTVFTKGASNGLSDAQLILDYSGFGSGTLSFYCTGGGTMRITTSAAVNDGIWHYVTAKRDGSTFTMWVDGVLVPNVTTISLNTDYDTYEADFGLAPGQGLYFYGIIDEARILTGSGVSNIALDWVKTEYNNQKAPATFSQCSAETAVVGKIRNFLS